MPMKRKRRHMGSLGLQWLLSSTENIFSMHIKAGSEGSVFLLPSDWLGVQYASGTFPVFLLSICLYVTA